MSHREWCGNLPRNYYVNMKTFNVRRDSAVGLATGYELDGGNSRTGTGINLSPLHAVQTCFAALQASYLIGTGGFFHGGKAARTWNWQLNSKQFCGQEYVDPYIHSFTSLHATLLRYNFTFHIYGKEKSIIFYTGTIEIIEMCMNSSWIGPHSLYFTLLQFTTNKCS
jgi:hypothetical protein